jgi:hypothetical protein
MRSTISLIALLLPGIAAAQLVDDYNPPKAACCQAGPAQTIANTMQDWNQLGRYHADNEKLKAQPAEPGRVVFMATPSLTAGSSPSTSPASPT